MFRHLVIISLIVLGSLSWCTGTASAKCESASALAVIHDSYRAMLIETGQQRLVAARTMLVLLGKDDGSNLASRLARATDSISEARLARTLRDGGTLARFVLVGGKPPPGVGQHSRNVAFLSSVFLSTGCRNSLPQARQGGSSQGQSPAPPAESRPKPETGKTDLRKISLLVVAGIATALLLAIAVRGALKSVHIRRSRVERQPRKPVAFEIDVAFQRDGQDVRLRVRAIDASAGGMKVDWEDAPEVGTAVNLSLPIGERSGKIMWSNAFYAGLMFDEFLDKEDVTRLSSIK